MKRLAWALLLATACQREVEPVGRSEPASPGVSITDPVTRAVCVRTSSTPSVIYAARNYYFCDAGAADRFRAAPEKYADR